MTSKIESDCQCWKETEDKLPHTVATAWVLFALARHKQHAVKEVEKAVERQMASGWWSMFPSTQDDKNASTSATAMTALALKAHLDQDLVPAETKDKVKQSVASAGNWLAKMVNSRTGRWSEYPPRNVGEKIEYLAVSALAIHTLRVTSGSSNFDGLWLSKLPWEVPRLLQYDQSNGHVYRTKGTITIDQVRHYLFPWMLRTTFEAAANGNAWQKARASAWLERALSTRLDAKDFQAFDDSAPEDWTMAEVLFALQALKER